MSVDLIIEIIGTVIGLAYLYLEYKASVWLWPVGILMSIFYVFIFFHGKFYADAAVYLYYIGTPTDCGSGHAAETKLRSQRKAWRCPSPMFRKDKFCP